MASEVPPQGQSSAISYICEQNSRDQLSMSWPLTFNIEYLKGIRIQKHLMISLVPNLPMEASVTKQSAQQ